MNRTRNKDIENVLRTLRHDTEVLPRDSYRTNARIRILNTIAMSQPTRSHRFRTFIIALLTAPTMLGAGTVLAAQTSNPGDILFPLKIVSEHVSLELAPTTQLKTTVAIGLMNRRVEEIQYAEETNDSEKLHVAQETMTQTMETIRETQKVQQDDVDEYIDNSSSIQEHIEEVTKQIPPSIDLHSVQKEETDKDDELRDKE